VTNQSAEKATAYTSSLRLVQGTRQLEEKLSFNTNYPRLPSDLLPGVEAEAVALFDPISASEPLRVVWDGPRLSNFRLNFQPYQWTVSDTTPKQEPSTAASQDAGQVVRDFLNAVAAEVGGPPKNSLQFLSSGLKPQAQTPGGLPRLLSINGQWRSVTIVSTEQGGLAGTLIVKATLNDDGRGAERAFTLVNEGGSWKIDRIQISTSDEAKARARALLARAVTERQQGKLQDALYSANEAVSTWQDYPEAMRFLEEINPLVIGTQQAGSARR